MSDAFTVLNARYASVVTKLRGTATEQEIDEDLEQINVYITQQIPDAKRTATLTNHRFVTLLINYPSIWMKIVLTFVFWITLDEKILSETIKQLFLNVDLNQNAALQDKFFSYNKFGSSEEAQEVAGIWYDKLILQNYSNNAVTLDVIKKLLENIIRKADAILINNAGSKARAACEASARGTTLFHYLKLMGCLSGLVAPGAECDAIKEALKNLIESAQDLDL